MAALQNLRQRRPAAGGCGRGPAAGRPPAQQPDPGACAFASTAPSSPAKAPDGLKTLLARAGEAPDFQRLEADLAAREAEVAGLFDALVV